MTRVGIIGCGSITRFRHAPEYFENPSAEIAGYYDTAEQRAQEMAREFGGKVYVSVEEMLQDPKIDAISVCTANKYHAPITIKALEAGKHVLCEKPLATNIADAERMIAAAQKAGKFLMVGHSQRLVEAHIKAKEIIKSGELGRVIAFKTSLMHKGPETWSAQKGTSTWFFKKDESAMGAMGDLGVHKIDLMRWLLDDEIQEVTAHIGTLDKKDGEGNPIGVDDSAFCILRTGKGAFGTLTASWVNYGPEENGTVLYCENGVLSVCTSHERPLFTTMKDGTTRNIPAGGIQTNSNQTKSGVIDMFIDSIEKGIKPEISGEEGLAALRIVAACFESSVKGKKVVV